MAPAADALVAERCVPLQNIVMGDGAVSSTTARASVAVIDAADGDQNAMTRSRCPSDPARREVASTSGHVTPLPVSDCRGWNRGQNVPGPTDNTAPGTSARLSRRVSLMRMQSCDVLLACAARDDLIEDPVELCRVERFRQQRHLRVVAQRMKLRVQDVAADEHEPVEHFAMPLLDAVVQREPAAVWHLDVAHDEVVVALFEELRRHLAVDRQVHRESTTRQQAAKQ